MAGRALKSLTWLVVAALLGAVAVLGWGYHRFNAPGPSAQETTVILPRGEGVLAIADRLARANIVSDAYVFAIGVRLYRAERSLRAGEYRIPARSSMLAVMHKLTAGETVVRRLTLAEGLTTAEALALLSQADGLVGVVKDNVEEGDLLPETYHYSYGDSRSDLLRRMQTSMNDVLSKAWSTRSPDLPLRTPEELLVLASIVEKETAQPHERAHIAGVFVNRLKKGMRLQSDPTVAYGLTKGSAPLSRSLTKADLRTPSDYNTYVISGLPPGPICNPGRAAIEAAAKPLNTRDLYFVADGNGGHAFAETYAAHRRNVGRWRRLQKNGSQ